MTAGRHSLSDLFHLGLLGPPLLLLLLLLPLEQLDLPGLLRVDGPRCEPLPLLSFLGTLAGQIVHLLTVERSLTHCHIFILYYYYIFGIKLLNMSSSTSNSIKLSKTDALIEVIKRH